MVALVCGAGAAFSSNLPPCPSSGYFHNCFGTLSGGMGFAYEYVGEFKNNKRHGKGTYTHANGTIKKGTWKDNRFLDTEAPTPVKKILIFLGNLGSLLLWSFLMIWGIRRLILLLNMNKRVSQTVKFLIQSVLNPTVFFVYLLSMSSGLGKGSATIFGISAFRRVSINVYAAEIGIFLPFAIGIYAIFFFLNYNLIIRFKKDFSFNLYKEKRLTWWCLIPCSIGGINLTGWIVGMEGNIFGLILGIPLLIAILIQLIQLVHQNFSLLRKGDAHK